ncbi:MAG TPA: sugar transferase [Spirochaetia bacterium]|nr:sugar transferase [Spirochaetia bacterium]
MKSARRPRQYFLLLVDIGVLALSLFVALLVRFQTIPSAELFWKHAAAFLPCWIFWIVSFYTANLYDVTAAFDEPGFPTRLFAAVAVGGLLSVLVFYVGNWSLSPKTILGLHAALLFFLTWLSRFLYGRISSRYLPRRATAFVGIDQTVQEIVAAVEKNNRLGYKTVALLDETGKAPEGVRSLAVRTPREFIESVQHNAVSLVVISDEDRLDDTTRQALLTLVDHSVRFMRLADFYELYLRRIPIGTINDVWFLENIDLRGKARYGVIKRGLDILVSFSLLLLCLAPWLLISLGIKLTSQGPILFRQKRLGRGGNPFSILKFRTMRVKGNDFSPTAVEDPRVTGFGRFLRRLNLDETPQFINILLGDMSFVGPRPERPELASTLERSVPYYRQRLLVKPGITGWDQVSGEYHSPSVEDTYKKLQYDLYYVKNMSALLDASIFFKTILTMILGRGR